MKVSRLCACALLALVSIGHERAPTLGVGLASAALQDEPAASDQVERSTGDWRKQLLEWRKMIGMELIRKKPPQWKITDAGVAKLDDLYELVAAIRDESAVPAISATLREEPHHLVRAIWLAPLPYIESEPARKLLVKYSVEDDSNNVREAATELLKGDPKKKDTIPDYVQYLRSPKFCTRAAIALRVSGIAQRVSPSEPLDPALADALIDALILTAKEGIPVWYHSWYKAARARPGGFETFSIQRSGTRLVPVNVPLPNPEMLKTLQEYSLMDCQYDREAWRREVRNQIGEAE